jgi:hypothetical protein
MTIVDRQPSRRFGNEKHENTQENRDNDETSEWLLICTFTEDTEGSPYDDRANQTSDIDPLCEESDDNPSKMSRGSICCEDIRERDLKPIRKTEKTTSMQSAWN